LNDFHSGACGGHLSGLEKSQNILSTRYFWRMIFKYCVEAVKCHPCQIFSKVMCVHPTPMFPVIIVGPLVGVDFMTCHLVSTRGHHYIIVVVEYFTKWEEAMPMFSSDGETTNAFCV
jgi:hypothetical protein